MSAASAVSLSYDGRAAAYGAGMSRDLMTMLSGVGRTSAARPLGDVTSVSGRTLRPFSQASHEAASNLLAKARRALARGDADRATRYVDRAVALPFDAHERALPAAWSAHLDLFCLVTDALDRSAPDDSAWLAAALDVLSTAEDEARFDLRDVLQVIDQDYLLNRDEHRRLRAATATVPPPTPLEDLVDLSADELRRNVLAVVAACNAYEAALEAYVPV
jgi:hypothetical protein